MFVCLSAVVFGFILSSSAYAQNVTGDAQSGESLYVSTGCYECHGFVGQGGAPGPAVAPPMAFEPFLFQLRQPRQVMIPYSEAVLSDAQAADIYAFLASLPPPPDPDSIPLLQTMP